MIRVLHVDDDPDLLTDTAQLLTNSGFLVRSELSFIRFQRSVREFSPQIVLLDLDMPGKNGFDLLKLLKSNGRTASTPVLFLTAHSEKSIMIKGLRSGLDDFVSKPFHPDELIERIRAVIRRSSAQKPEIHGERLLTVYLKDRVLLEKSQPESLGRADSIFQRMTHSIGRRTDLSGKLNCAFLAADLWVSQMSEQFETTASMSHNVPFPIQRIARAANRALNPGKEKLLVPEDGYLVERNYPKFFVSIQENRNALELVSVIQKSAEYKTLNS